MHVVWKCWINCSKQIKTAIRFLVNGIPHIKYSGKCQTKIMLIIEWTAHTHSDFVSQTQPLDLQWISEIEKYSKLDWIFVAIKLHKHVHTDIDLCCWLNKPITKETAKSDSIFGRYQKTTGTRSECKFSKLIEIISNLKINEPISVKSMS